MVLFHSQLLGLQQDFLHMESPLLVYKCQLLDGLINWHSPDHGCNIPHLERAILDVGPMMANILQEIKQFCKWLVEQTIKEKQLLLVSFPRQGAEEETFFCCKWAISWVLEVDYKALHPIWKYGTRLYQQFHWLVEKCCALLMVVDTYCQLKGIFETVSTTIPFLKNN